MHNARFHWALGVILLAAAWVATSVANAGDPLGPQVSTAIDAVVSAAPAQGGAESEAGSAEENASATDADEEPNGEKAKPSEEKAKEKAEGDEEEKPETDAKPKPATITVEGSPLKVTVEVSGVIVADEAHEVVLEPDSWSSFELVEAVEHGARVRKGQTLLRFDPEEIDEAIDDLKAQQEIADLAISKAKSEQPLIEQVMELQKKAADRATRIAKEDTDRYFNIERDIDVEQADRYVTSAQFSYENALEELKQLQQMYEADDLTEETEEIILKRQQYYVDLYKFYLETAKLSRERMQQFSIPRMDESYKYSLEITEIAHKRAQLADELALNESRYALETALKKYDRDKEKMEDLLSDRALMEVDSPAAGIAYYGQAVQGKWSQILSTKAKLLPGKKVMANAVLMTIVDPAKIHVEFQVAEKDYQQVREARDAKIEVPALGGQTLSGRVAEVSSVPVAQGSFAGRLQLDASSDVEPLPGMNCQVKIVTYKNKNALLVPSSAVAHDDWTDEDYVMVVEDEEQPRRQVVNIGHKQGSNVEIVEGVSAGDKILKENKKG